MTRSMLISNILRWSSYAACNFWTSSFFILLISHLINCQIIIIFRHYVYLNFSIISLINYSLFLNLCLFFSCILESFIHSFLSHIHQDLFILFNELEELRCIDSVKSVDETIWKEHSLEHLRKFCIIFKFIWLSRIRSYMKRYFLNEIINEQ